MSSHHNLWCNEKNGRQPIMDALAEMPLDRIWEVHLAGGQELEGYRLDAHSGPVPEELLELAAAVVPALPNLHAVIFEIMPAYLSSGRVSVDDVAEELRRLRCLWNSRGRPAAEAHGARPPGAAACAGFLPAPDAWESTLGRAVVGVGSTAGGDAPPVVEGPFPLAASVQADPGTGVIREVLGRARAGMVDGVLARTIRLVLFTTGEGRLAELLDDFWAGAPPEQFAEAEGEAFGEYLLRHGGDIPQLADIVALELAVLRAAASGSAQRVELGCDPRRAAARRRSRFAATWRWRPGPPRRRRPRPVASVHRAPPRGRSRARRGPRTAIRAPRPPSPLASRPGARSASPARVSCSAAAPCRRRRAAGYWPGTVP